MIKLYHYIHCPFCIRVRMALGLLNTPYTSEPLGYDDEKKPTELCGKKMLPILKDGEIAMNESLDIIAHLDKKNVLKLEVLKNTQQLNELEDLLNRLGKPIHNLCMPYWAWTKEFTPEAREYFINKKSVKRGPFNALARNKQQFLDELSPLLEELEKKIGPFYNQAQELSVFDLMIASHIWGMYIFPEFQFSPKIHSYLQRVKELCNFNYHEDFWRD